MIYTMLTIIWKFSLSHDVKGLADPLTRLLNNHWLKTYNILGHTFITNSKDMMLEFTFELDKLGEFTPQILGSICYTIITCHKAIGFKDEIAIILIPHYLDGDTWTTGHYLFTNISTPEDFTKHFIHLTDKDVNSESIIVELVAKVLVQEI